MRLDIRSKEKITEAGKAEAVGNRVKVKVVKNKVNEMMIIISIQAWF